MKKYLLIVVSLTFLACSNNETQKKFTLDLESYPDFSYVGYKYGEKKIPERKDLQIFNVMDYGAVPNDDISDETSIRKTIQVAILNGGGVVYLPKGKYLMSTDLDSPGYDFKNHDYSKLNSPTPSVFPKGNIILRGEKNALASEGGTEIEMINELRSKTPELMWTSPFLFDFRGPQERGEYLGKIVKDAKQGDFKISVSKIENMRVGDWLILNLREPSKNILKDIFKNKNIENSWTAIKDLVLVRERHQIVEIDKENKVVTFKEPLKSDVNSKQKWNINKYSNSSEVGVEKIYFKGNADKYLAHDNNGKFKHHKNVTHDGGWSILKFYNLTDSWIRDCSFENVSRSITIEYGAAVTVTDIDIKGSQGHNGVSVSQSMGILVSNVNDSSSAWHASGLGPGSIGNVFYNNTHTSETSFESHSAQPRHNLFDNIQGGLHINHFGGAKENLPNHMEGLVLWNYKQTNLPTNPFTFWSQGDRHDKVLNPRIIGIHGTPHKIKNEEVLENISWGVPVTPVSLYEFQLKRRINKNINE